MMILMIPVIITITISIMTLLIGMVTTITIFIHDDDNNLSKTQNAVNFKNNDYDSKRYGTHNNNSDHSSVKHIMFVNDVVIDIDDNGNFIEIDYIINNTIADNHIDNTSNGRHNNNDNNDTNNGNNINEHFNNINNCYNHNVGNHGRNHNNNTNIYFDRDNNNNITILNEHNSFDVRKS